MNRLALVLLVILMAITLSLKADNSPPVIQTSLCYQTDTASCNFIELNQVTGIQPYVFDTKHIECIHCYDASVNPYFAVHFGELPVVTFSNSGYV